MGQDVVNVGQSVVIRGELSASEDLTIEGQVEGKIDLGHNVLTVGPNARIRAQVLAKVVIVMDNVNGNITATDEDQHSREGLRERRPCGTPCAHCRRGLLPRPHQHAKLTGPEGPCGRHGHGEATGSSATGWSGAPLGRDVRWYPHGTSLLNPNAPNRSTLIKYVRSVAMLVPSKVGPTIVL